MAIEYIIVAVTVDELKLVQLGCRSCIRFNLDIIHQRHGIKATSIELRKKLKVRTLEGDV